MAAADGLVDTFHQVVAASREENIAMMAAGLAYHAFNSLIPALLLAFAGMSYVGELVALSPILATTMGVSEDAFREVLQQAGSNQTGQFRAVIIAAFIFLWSAGRLFDSMQSAFEEVYGGTESKRRVELLVNVAIAFGTMATAVVVITVLVAGLSTVLSGVRLWLITPLLLVAVLFVVFFPMYYLFPHSSVNVREAIPGTAFAAVAWALSGIGFRFYAATSESVQLYGLVGGLLLLLTWLYVGGFTLMLGVTLNGVVADRIDPA